MRRIRWTFPLSLALLVACGDRAPEPPTAPSPPLAAERFDPERSPWSEPVNLGPPINSPANEHIAALSRDELSLYFTSNRTDLPGFHGGMDLWVSRRDCRTCPWGTPVNLGPTINTARNDGGPSLSADGHLLFFNSNRDGTADIYMSRRSDPNDDLGWRAPMKLGPEVNTPDQPEQGAELVHAGDGATGHLYFNRGLIPGLGADIYVVPFSRSGEARGPAEPVEELNLPGVNDANPTVREDGREIFFWSFPREGEVGGGDLFVSTRSSAHDAWSAPENMGPTVNSAFADIAPRLSHDGRTLLFWSNRPGSAGRDIWMTTRREAGGGT